jgi:hypothetical protein
MELADANAVDLLPSRAVVQEVLDTLELGWAGVRNGELLRRADELFEGYVAMIWT